MSNQITRSTIVTGAEFRDFFTNHWPEGYVVEDLPYEVQDEDGVWHLADDARHPLSYFGYAVPDGGAGKARPICEVYAEAMAGREDEVILTFRVSRERAEALIAAGEDLGARHI